METNDIKEVNEANAPVDPAPVEGLTEAQASAVAGGDGDCTTRYSVGTDGANVVGPVEGGNIISATYDGAINGMSYVMERLSRAVNDY